MDKGVRKQRWLLYNRVSGLGGQTWVSSESRGAKASPMGCERQSRLHFNSSTYRFIS
jgi:hypothetical protein